MPRKTIRTKKIRKFLKGSKRTRFYKNKLSSKIKYPYSTRVQTFGPGVFKINIEQDFIIDADQEGLYLANVAGYINNAVEFQQYASRFMFYKVEQIGLTVFPNKDIENLETGLGIDWFNMVTDAQGFLTWDSKKLFFNKNIRAKTFFFRIPSTLLEGLNSGSWNFRNFNAVNIKLPGKVAVYIPGVARVQGRITARVAFKVPRPGNFNKNNNNNENFRFVSTERLINVPKSKFGPAVFQDKSFKTRFQIEEYLEKKQRKREEKELQKELKEKEDKKGQNINKNKKGKNKKNKNKKNKNSDDKFDIFSVQKVESLVFKNMKKIEDEVPIPSCSISLNTSLSQKSKFEINKTTKKEYIRDLFLKYGLGGLPKIKNNVAYTQEEIKDFIDDMIHTATVCTNLDLHTDAFIKNIQPEIETVNEKGCFNNEVANMILRVFKDFLRNDNAISNDDLKKWFYLLRDGNFDKLLEDENAMLEQNFESDSDYNYDYLD